MQPATEERYQAGVGACGLVSLVAIGIILGVVVLQVIWLMIVGW